MAKRFTDTDKWKKEWFSELDPKAKLVWLYILDQCDHSGIWPRNFTLLTQQTSIKVDEQQFLAWFHGKVIKFDFDKFFIPAFFEFQYGSSKDGFKAKHSALANLVKLGLMDSDGTVRNTTEHFGTLPNTSEQYMDCPSISKSISISTSKSNINSDENFKKVTDEQLEALYKKYPRKSGKTDGIAKARKDIRSEQDLFNLEAAIDKYTQVLTRDKTDPKFIRHFSTFMTSWRDWLDEDAGTSTRTNKSFANERDINADDELDQLTREAYASVSR